MRHEFSGTEALPREAAFMAGEILADGQGHAVDADTSFFEALQISRMTSPAPIQRTVRDCLSSSIYRMAAMSSVSSLHARRLFNDNAHVNRRAPPGRNPGGGRKRKQD